jgi:FkbM family methyltransferase
MIKIKFVNIISKLLNSLPENWKNYIFGIVLCYFPMWLIKIIPCSYSAYLKCYSPKKGDVIMDCGAHIGNCTMLFSRLVGENGLVIALEPFEESFKTLKCRINRLNRKNIIAINKGVWNVTGCFLLKIFSNTLSCQVATNLHPTNNSNNSTYIDCVTIDDLLDELKLNRLDMIKMDIEGAEIEALQGSEKTLSNYCPHVAIASYHNRDDEPTYHKVEEILYCQGYTANTFFPPHFTTCGKKYPSD